MRHLELPFTGPATFLKAPYRALTEPWRTDVAFLGLPYDFAVGFRPGARFAPGALRRASGRFAPGPAGFFDLETGGVLLRGVSLVDAGDVDPAQLEYRTSFERMTAAARELRRRATLPVFVGGDHSVSYPLLRAYDDVEDFCVVQLDAHLDYSDDRNGTRYANSSPFRRAVEEVLGLKHIIVIGLRGLRTNPEAYRAAEVRGHTLVTARRVRTSLDEVLALLPKDKKVYLSFDIDVLDPSLAPGTGSPEVEGLDYGEALALVGAAIQGNELIGLDVTEVAPNLDPSGLTSLVAARLLAEAVALWWRYREVA